MKKADSEGGKFLRDGKIHPAFTSHSMWQMFDGARV